MEYQFTKYVPHNKWDEKTLGVASYWIRQAKM